MELPYKSMVIEALSQAGFGGLRFAVNFMEDSFKEQVAVAKPQGLVGPSLRPWCVLELSSRRRVYLPALSPALRQAAANRHLLWVQVSEALAPQVTLALLESGLCSGVLLHALDRFSKTQTAALWGRRWQLAAHKGATHLIWVHEKPQALIGFDVRLEWTQKNVCQIKKGHGYFNEQRIKKTLFVEPPAA